MQLWLIPILPLLGFLLNGIFGKRLSKPVINTIAVGSVVLSFLWVVKSLNGLGAFSGGLDQTYKEHYYTWIQSGTLNIGTAVIDLIDPCGIGSNGGFHADHSLVAGRAAGCGHCPDDHARHLIKKRKRPESP